MIALEIMFHIATVSLEVIYTIRNINISHEKNQSKLLFISL